MLYALVILSALVVLLALLAWHYWLVARAARRDEMAAVADRDWWMNECKAERSGTFGRMARWN